MAKPEQHAYQVTSVSFTREQVQRLEAVRAARSTPERVVSRSELLREIITFGLNHMSFAPDSILPTSPSEPDENAA